MRRRIKKLEMALGAKSAAREFDLDAVVPRSVHEDLMRAYGEPGEVLVYTGTSTYRDAHEAIARIYGEAAGGS